MLRSQIKETIENVSRAFSDSGVSHLLLSIGQARRERVTKEFSSETLLETISKWSLEVSRFNDEERKLLDIFGLDNFLSASVWQPLVPLLAGKENELSGSEMFELVMVSAKRIQFLKETAPALVELFEQHKSVESSASSMSSKSLGHNSIMTVILPEDRGEATSPSRISGLMTAMEGMYDVLVSLNQLVDPEPIIVVSVDSGSDKSFDFFGAAKLMEQLKELVLGIYDRKIVARASGHNEFLDAVKSTLPVLAQLDAAEKAGTINSEQCQKLKHKLVTSAEQFSAVGAITQEMIDVTPPEPRKIMKQETLMLKGPSNE